MRKATPEKRWLTCIHALLLLSLIMSIAQVFVDSVSAAPTTVRVSPPSITAEVGNNFSINMTISNVLNLYAWEFKLGWNPALLDLVNVSEGSFLRAGGDTFFTYKTNTTFGYMIVDCTLLGLVPGVSGSGTLTTITFHVKTAGECPLDLYDVLLLDPFERTIPCDVVDGYGHFTSSSHDIAITEITVSPLNVFAGEIVHINVTVQNQGGYAESFSVTAYVNSETIGTQSTSLDSGASATIPFMWNTTGHNKGEYAISASASIVSSEVDTADNNKTANDKVIILTSSHDIAITNIESAKTIVGQGYTMNITVTLRNYGIYSENLDVTAYANEALIQTQTTTLASGASTILTFTWSTTDWPKTNYTISVTAEAVPDEIDVSDNTRFDGIVRIGIPGDLNGDDFVGIDDVFFVASHFGLGPADSSWEPNCDITDDAYVGIDDIFIVALHFGEEG